MKSLESNLNQITRNVVVAVDVNIVVAVDANIVVVNFDVNLFN